MPVTSLPSSSNSLTSTIGAGLPHEPGLRSWSAGSSTVFTPSSVEPYTSNSDSAGKSRTYICFRAKLHGAALAIMRLHRRACRSGAFTSSGSEQIMRIGRRRRERGRHPVRLDQPQPVLGSNLRCSTTVWPSTWAMPMKPPGPEWYSGPVVMYTSSGV